MNDRFLSNIPWKSVSWLNSSFLIGTLLLALTVVPAYLWANGLSLFQAALFVFFFIATGLSITLGYHRLFSHLTFRARWPVRLFTLLFGAAAFENSALDWVSDHRRHHKFVDHDDDPYDISKGFFFAHIGWTLFKLRPNTPMDNVADLQRDALVRWQFRYYVPIAIFVSLVLPTLIGLAWGGWKVALGSFLIAGIARIVCVHHMTFFINSLCHTLGRQPYSSRCTARDSAVMAFFTFGEGYHNFHHEFQHDYRNGVKPWQFDPTKWAIWLLSKTGLVRDLRRVPPERILAAELDEENRQLARQLASISAPLATPKYASLRAAQERLHEAMNRWEERKGAYLRCIEEKIHASREKLAELKRDFEEAAAHLRAAIEHWRSTHRLLTEAQLT